MNSRIRDVLCRTIVESCINEYRQARRAQMPAIEMHMQKVLHENNLTINSPEITLELTYQASQMFQNFILERRNPVSGSP